jgi:hypothetical protein
MLLMDFVEAIRKFCTTNLKVKIVDVLEKDTN